jgi:YggT family protein
MPIVLIVNVIYYTLLILIIARIILSFVNIGGYELRELVFRLTEPILAPIRKILPPMGGLDFSPMVVLIVADLLRRFIFSNL